MNYSSLFRLNKSDLFDFCYENLPFKQISSFPWCEKKYVGMKYFSKDKLLELAQSIFANLYF